MYKGTYHARVEREDRISTILAYIGYNEIILRKTTEDGKRVECITDTGVLLVLSKNEQKIITMYIPNDKKISVLCSLTKQTRQSTEIIRKSCHKAQKIYDKYI